MASARCLFFVALALTAGCYATHGRSGGTVDADRPDAQLTPPDAPPPDATRPDTGTDSSVVPDVCARDIDCPGSHCVLDTSAPPRDGDAVRLICGTAGPTVPGLECDEGAICENGLCALAGGCFDPCVEDGDCRDGEHCMDVVVPTGPGALQQALGCVRWVDAPGSVTITENDTISVMPFTSQLFSVPRASTTHRLVQHVADRLAESRTIDRVSLSGAGGGLLHDISDVGLRPQINPAVAHFDTAPILIPNAPWPIILDPRAPLAYAMTTGGEAQMRRIVMEHEGTGTTLDLDIFYIGVRRDARARRMLDLMLERYEPILMSAGVRLGRVREHVAEGSAATGFSVLDDESEIGSLFRWSAGAARPAINVFLIQSSPLFSGVAGGIPGAQAVHGTRSSGIALSFGDLMDAVDGGLDPSVLAVVLAHEVGHFLGLFHTSEGDGTSLEPLADTPRCDISHDRNGDGMVDGDECFDADGENIMFWAAISPSSSFSLSQETVIRSSPVMLP